MDNPCAEIWMPKPIVFEVGDKLILSKTGNYAHIYDIKDDSRIRTVYMRRSDGGSMDVPYDDLRMYVVESGVIIIKPTKLPEDLFTI